MTARLAQRQRVHEQGECHNLEPMATLDREPEKLAKLRSALLGWYARNRRDLPWRRSADPYAIWVSEIMLQQTRVAVVVERYQAFLARFPSLAALAQATEEEVLALWSGLGYYRRARMLHKAAQFVAEPAAGQPAGQCRGAAYPSRHRRLHSRGHCQHCLRGARSRG